MLCATNFHSLASLSSFKFKFGEGVHDSADDLLGSHGSPGSGRRSGFTGKGPRFPARCLDCLSLLCPLFVSACVFSPTSRLCTCQVGAGWSWALAARTLRLWCAPGGWRARGGGAPAGVRVRTPVALSFFCHLMSVRSWCWVGATCGCALLRCHGLRGASVHGHTGELWARSWHFLMLV